MVDQRIDSARDSLSWEEGRLRTRLTNLDAVIALLDDTVGRIHAESNRESEKYLCWASEHPLFVGNAARGR